MPEPPHSILVVDDEPHIRLLLARSLEDDYDVDTAASGEEALEKLAGKPIDLVITDQRMPGMTGIELLARVRQRWPDTVRIVLTAYSDAGAMLDAINRGEVYRFMVKPWDPPEMRLTIRQGLERLQLERERRRLLQELKVKTESIERSMRELADARDRLLRAEKLALIGRFATGIAHDIRNYLLPMMNMGTAARRHPEDTLLRKVADAVEDGAREVVDMLRELSALAQNRIVEYALSPGDLGGVAREAVSYANLAEPLRDRRIQIVDRGAPAALLAPAKARRVLMNLIQNAIQAGARSVEVRIFADGGRPRAAIIDDGPGIAPDIQERIWEPFFSTKESGGAGLGLDICRVIMGGHGGRIWCESRPGEGTTFHLEFEPAP